MPLPAFLVPLLVYLGPLLSAIAFRIAMGFGVGVASYVGLTVLMASVASQIASTFTGLGADLLAMVYILRIDQCINLLLSAYTARLSLVGMTALGALSRTIQLPPPS